MIYMKYVLGGFIVLLAANTLATVPESVEGDVVVYGATLSGCMAAISASRSGANKVVLATPYIHVGGMTTGGLQHADPGNESTVHGITREFFDRVMAHYPPSPAPAPPPNSRKYACRANRCIEVTDGHGHSDQHCNNTCPQLQHDEWLAVTSLSKLSDGNTTLTVRLPRGQNISYFKKSEQLEKHLPASMVQKIHEGQVFHLTSPAVDVDSTYLLIHLPSSPLRRLAHATQTDVSPPRLNLNSPPGLQPISPPGLDLNSPPGFHPGAPPGWKYEGHVAEAVLEEMLKEANVTIIRGLGGLLSAEKEGTRLVSVTAEGDLSQRNYRANFPNFGGNFFFDGVRLLAKVWIDASYEGELVDIAGADMVWGRESVSQYNESGAGRRPPSVRYNVDPFWEDGSVIPHVSDLPLVPVGEADKRMQVYTFRLCLTDSPGHSIPITKPDHYNASEWEFWRRLYKNGSSAPPDLKSAGLGCLGPIPNNYSDCDNGVCTKCDMLGMVHGTDMLNGAWYYPNATISGRRQIREAHIRYIEGLLWFWASDPSTGDSLHAEMKSIGYCTDEYGPPQTYPEDPPHWPYQLYVREAKRLVGDFVWTENDPSVDMLNRSVGVGAYTFDCHWCSLYVERDKGTAQVVAEGRVNNGRNGQPARGVLQTPFRIPYDTLVPKRSQLTNILAPVACSSSHLRFNAIRMEPVWGVMGQSAGVAATMTLANGMAVQDVSVSELQRMLLQQNQMIVP